MEQKITGEVAKGVQLEDLWVLHLLPTKTRGDGRGPDAKWQRMAKRANTPEPRSGAAVVGYKVGRTQGHMSQRPRNTPSTSRETKCMGKASARVARLDPSSEFIQLMDFISFFLSLPCLQCSSISPVALDIVLFNSLKCDPCGFA